MGNIFSEDKSAKRMEFFFYGRENPIKIFRGLAKGVKQITINIWKIRFHSIYSN